MKLIDDYIKRDSVIKNIISLTTCDSVEEIKEIVYSNFHLKSNEWIGGIYDALLAVGEVAGHDLAVTHCKDCKWWKSIYSLYGREHKACVREAYELVRRAEDFCSRGERRDEDESEL